MKKYKELKKKLHESEYVEGPVLGGWPAPNSTRSASDDFGVHRIDHDSQIKRLQAFLTAFTGREYLDPRAALSLMRLKLNLAGIDFDFNNKTNLNSNQTTNFKVKRFGGTFGTTPEHDLSKGFKVTDGVEDILGGDHLVLSVTITEAESGLYKMDAKLVRQSGSEQGETEQNSEIE